MRNQSLWAGFRKKKYCGKDCEWADFYCNYLFNYGLYFTLAQNHIKQNILWKHMTD